MKILKLLGKVIAIALAALLLIAAAVVLFLMLSPAVGKHPDKEERAGFEQRSKQYREGRFHNEDEMPVMGGKAYPASSRRMPKKKLPAAEPSLIAAPGEGDLSFTWLGHSAFLLQYGARNILIDPMLGERTSPVSFAGPKRFSELPLTADELPDIDVVFISHDHYDHLDYRTILKIKDRAGVFICPLGVDAILRGWGVEEEKIFALDWWESVETGGLSFTLTPSQHFSGRDPLKRDTTLWGGLYIAGGPQSVYYTGDGGYCKAFKEVGERLGAPDLMIAECGQYDTAWPSMHMFPEETVQAGKDAKASWLIPVHWGSFSICNHAWDDSVTRVTAAAADQGLDIAVPMMGQTVDFDELASVTARWWEDCE